MDAKSIILRLNALGMSQVDIAAGTGISRSAISHIVVGRRKDTRLSTYTKLLQLLNDRQDPLTSSSANGT